MGKQAKRCLLAMQCQAKYRPAFADRAGSFKHDHGISRRLQSRGRHDTYRPAWRRFALALRLEDHSSAD